MEMKFQVLEMQKWNLSKNRTVRVDKKNGGHLSSYVYYES